MNISIVSVFPHLYDTFLTTSLVGRACEQEVVKVKVIALTDHAAPKKRIDSPTFGPSAGMLLGPDVIAAALEGCEKEVGRSYKIFFSPHGKKLDQKLLKKIVQRAREVGHIMFVPARYEGMDARVEQYYADEIISLGDFVLMGGDLPVMVMLEGMMRLLPDVIGKQESVEQDSFSGPFVDYPEYTAPVVWKKLEVPKIIRSGNHAAIEAWRMHEAVQRTVKHHFQWLRSSAVDKNQIALVGKYMPAHYVALMHTEVVVKDCLESGKGSDTTSVTSIDIHDIARSAKTYGVERFFIVTPLLDQQKIVRTLLNFWQEGVGVTYNTSRHEAVRQVELKNSLFDVCEKIREKEGKEPIVIATTARPVEGIEHISYYDQELVWSHDRPILLIFGTGQGLSEKFLRRCDYTLKPVRGFSDYNHLSVRSAVAIILDRWLGINEKM